MILDEGLYPACFPLAPPLEGLHSILVLSARLMPALLSIINQHIPLAKSLSHVTVATEKLWMPHPWKCSRPGWMGLWATWSAERCPCSWQGFGTGWSLRSFPTQTILWKSTQAGSKAFWNNWLTSVVYIANLKKAKLLQAILKWSQKFGFQCFSDLGWADISRDINWGTASSRNV